MRSRFRPTSFEGWTERAFALALQPEGARDLYARLASSRASVALSCSNSASGTLPGELARNTVRHDARLFFARILVSLRWVTNLRRVGLTNGTRSDITYVLTKWINLAMLPAIVLKQRFLSLKRGASE